MAHAVFYHLCTLRILRDCSRENMRPLQAGVFLKSANRHLEEQACACLNTGVFRLLVQSLVSGALVHCLAAQIQLHSGSVDCTVQ